jgi:opacity protein-like surface antigen
VLTNLEVIMKIVIVAAAVTLLTAAPVLAQGKHASLNDGNGYVTGLAGFATSTGNTTGDVRIEGGVRIAPHVKLFGDIGHFGNLQGDLQPTLDATTSSLAANQGIAVLGGGKLPASYFTGGLRFDVPTGTRLTPYLLGGVGVAHLNPTAQFTFSSGTLPDGTTPDAGTDVTSALTQTGMITVPAASSAFMFTLGGGVQIPVTRHWAGDVGYRYSRIAADDSLSASPLDINGMTFGFGYRF